MTTKVCGNCGRDLGVHTFCNSCLTNTPGAPPPLTAMERIAILEGHVAALLRRVRQLEGDHVGIFY